MSVTAWERLRALSDRVRAVWDAHRGSDPTAWPSDFEAARERCAARMEADAAMVRGLSYSEFGRLQGFADKPQPVEA